MNFLPLMAGNYLRVSVKIQSKNPNGAEPHSLLIDDLKKGCIIGNINFCQSLSEEILGQKNSISLI